MLNTTVKGEMDILELRMQRIVQVCHYVDSLHDLLVVIYTPCSMNTFGLNQNCCKNKINDCLWIFGTVIKQLNNQGILMMVFPKHSSPKISFTLS